MQTPIKIAKSFLRKIAHYSYVRPQTVEESKENYQKMKTDFVSLLTSIAEQMENKGKEAFSKHEDKDTPDECYQCWYQQGITEQFLEDIELIRSIIKEIK